MVSQTAYEFFSCICKNVFFYIIYFFEQHLEDAKNSFCQKTGTHIKI